MARARSRPTIGLRHPAQPYLNQEGGALLFPESFTREQIAEAIAAYLKANPKVPYVLGEKWGLGLFPDGHPGTEWVDSLVSDHPAVFRDETRHGAVVNTAMLKYAGITRDTPQIKYGLIEKHPRTGEPTGYLADKPIGWRWWGDGTPLSKTILLVATYADGGHGAMSADRSDFDRMIEEARKSRPVRVHAMATARSAPSSTCSSRYAGPARRPPRSLITSRIAPSCATRTSLASAGSTSWPSSRP